LSRHVCCHTLLLRSLVLIAHGQRRVLCVALPVGIPLSDSADPGITVVPIVCAWCIFLSLSLNAILATVCVVMLLSQQSTHVSSAISARRSVAPMMTRQTLPNRVCRQAGSVLRRYPIVLLWCSVRTLQRNLSRVLPGGISLSVPSTP